MGPETIVRNTNTLLKLFQEQPPQNQYSHNILLMFSKTSNSGHFEVL